MDPTDPILQQAPSALRDIISYLINAVLPAVTQTVMPLHGHTKLLNVVMAHPSDPTVHIVKQEADLTTGIFYNKLPTRTGNLLDNNGIRTVLMSVNHLIKEKVSSQLAAIIHHEQQTLIRKCLCQQLKSEIKKMELFKQFTLDDDINAIQFCPTEQVKEWIIAKAKATAIIQNTAPLQEEEQTQLRYSINQPNKNKRKKAKHQKWYV